MVAALVLVLFCVRGPLARWPPTNAPAHLQGVCNKVWASILQLLDLLRARNVHTDPQQTDDFFCCCAVLFIGRSRCFRARLLTWRMRLTAGLRTLNLLAPAEAAADAMMGLEERREQTAPRATALLGTRTSSTRNLLFRCCLRVCITRLYVQVCMVLFGGKGLLGNMLSLLPRARGQS